MTSVVRALVVEDEPDLAALVGSYLERAGMAVTLCHDGLQAVALARQVDPEVIVLDLGLPSLDGIEVCRQVRTFSDAYVVMLTARSDEVDAAWTFITPILEQWAASPPPAYPNYAAGSWGPAASAELLERDGAVRRQRAPSRPCRARRSNTCVQPETLSDSSAMPVRMIS